MSRIETRKAMIGLNTDSTVNQETLRKILDLRNKSRCLSERNVRKAKGLKGKKKEWYEERKRFQLERIVERMGSGMPCTPEDLIYFRKIVGKSEKIKLQNRTSSIVVFGNSRSLLGRRS